MSAIGPTVVCHYTQPPQGSTTISTDELGPVVPRTFPPAPGWSPTGHRIKAVLDYSRGPEKTWVYGALHVRDGKELTRCTASRNSKNSIALLTDIEAENPTGDIFIRDALAGQGFANADEIEQSTRLATAQLNHRAKPWVWDVHLKHDGVFADSFVTGFKEQSIRKDMQRWARELP